MSVIIKDLRRILCKDKEEEERKVREEEEAVVWELDVGLVETVYVPIAEKGFLIRGVSHVLK